MTLVIVETRLVIPMTLMGMILLAVGALPAPHPLVARVGLARLRWHFGGARVGRGAAQDLGGFEPRNHLAGNRLRRREDLRSRGVGLATCFGVWECPCVSRCIWR